MHWDNKEFLKGVFYAVIDLLKILKGGGIVVKPKKSFSSSNDKSSLSYLMSIQKFVATGWTSNKWEYLKM
jgi:hypothetical protein